MTEHGLSEADRIAMRVAGLTEALTQLPAVATLDWADRAAAAMSQISPAAVACVFIGRVEAQGNFVLMDAVGVAAEGAPDDSAAMHALRTRAHAIRSLGLPVDLTLLQSRPLVGTLEAISAGRDWRHSPLATLFGGDPAGILLGVGALGSDEPGRVIIPAVSLGTRARDGNVGKLRAVLPLLVRKALVAVGTRTTSTEDWLTDRERIVLERLTRGESVRQIADALQRSPHTVHDHVKSLHRKLNASSRGELIARALGHLTECSGVRRRNDDRPSVLRISDVAPAPLRLPASADRASLAEPKPLTLAPVTDGDRPGPRLVED